MLTRALVVLLLILNLGVALWWITRAPPPPAPAPALPASAEPLRLRDEPVPAPAPTTAPVAAAAAEATDDAPAVAAAPEPEPAPVVSTDAEPAPVCIAFGPFADADAAGAARARLQPAAQQVSMRESRAAPRGWRVILPAQADRAAADAAAARLTRAGFRDHYIMAAAADGRMDIALGRFGGEAAALRHQGALREAGFDAVAEPIGDAGEVRHWIDARLDKDADVAALRRTAGATRADAVDCGTLAAAAR